MTSGATTPAVSPARDVASAVERLVAAPPPLLVVADFDGTLAAGTRDPGAATIEPGSRRALRRLAALTARGPGRVHLVVLTGRTVADVASRARVGGVEYRGDHGLQHGWLARGGRVTAMRVTTEPRFEPHHDPAERLAAGVAHELGDPPWLFVERKGPSVAFHVRQADDVAAARAAVIEAIAAVEAREGLTDHGLEHYRGRSVVDLRPRDAGGKREAVTALIDRVAAGAVVVLGDELSDVDAFEAVRSARDARGLVGVAMAVHGSTRPAPDELRAVADLELASSRAVARFLGDLARALEREERSDGPR